MAFWHKLGLVSDYLRRLRLSLGPDSYFQYRRARNYERERADKKRERVEDSAEQERADAERDVVREGEYDERYTAERERSERADEGEPRSR